jgi:HTH-type transcriptional repressor of NAD biosynthesis genes
MTRFAHGLVVGKFYPPHAGHHFLIDTASARCDALTVVVAGSAQESISPELRAEWVRERHPAVEVVDGYDEHPIDYDDPDVWSLHVAVFKKLCPHPVDVVFSSEPYGDELARRFGATHVPVDVSRATVPVSGSAIRERPDRHWSVLTPPVRAWLTKRVAVVGAESTGTTTLVKDLADHYGTAWVPEYGREFTEGLVRDGMPLDAIPWDDEDFEWIAKRQQELEDAAARSAGPVLICDTDALATCIWQERYLGRSTSAVERLAAARSYSLYLLTYPEDVPFEQDGYRDGGHVRSWMTGRFAERLENREEPCVDVRGPREARLAAAVAAVDRVLDAGWALAPPR